MRVGLVLRRARGVRTAALAASLLAVTPMAAVAPAQAAPAIQQGEAIRGPNNSPCALSIVSATTAYTAMHCLEGGKVGDEITSRAGAGVIGRVSALGTDLPQGKQLDVAKIDLAPGVTVKGHVGAGDSARLKSGDPVQIKAPGNRGRGAIVDPNPKWYSIKNDGKFYSFIISADIQTFGGNSGGALLDAQDNLVGVLAGGNTRDRSYYTPINEIRALLG